MEIADLSKALIPLDQLREHLNRLMAMQFHRTFDRLPSLGRPVVCAIGMFDGFHLGHQSHRKDLKLAQDHGAMATVLTFQNHPESILGKGSPPP